MTSVLLAVSGSDCWTLADGTKHPSGYWPEELVVPHQVFRAEGLKIIIATPGGAVPTPDKAGFAPEMNGGSETRGNELARYIESIDDELRTPATLEQLDPADFDFVFVPGGHGPMEDLAVSENFGALLSAMYQEGRPVAAVCHGPAALFPARQEDESWLFSGYRVTGFTNDEEEKVGFASRASWLLEDRLKAEGGHFERSPGVWEPHVVVDRNLYTGQNPSSSELLAKRVVADIGTRS